ncbi:flagellar basal-body MS-ring/collar protein FliF [Micavibrio aeruginosavorus]|uniref:Flagellar M-ring protein n=1 Tax=Micavibrio aeruginosavorus (strain ARL-13) TaxID=856793 RepID=G2KQG5_MICAA|nr:flagellar basal-body MS-ring/collar protein FliF [Micavibrio aeruginosavorus]AEP09101.1 flagellar M-ring protein FliF [Micavibrio aeruginosavorus ARL-13]
MNSFMDTLRQLGPARLGIMGGVLVTLLIFFIFVSMRVSTPSLKLLYSDLSSTDSASVAAKLEESQIRYDVSPDGTRIMVPESEVGRARMLLAEAGLPNGGSMGYELFDKQSGFGTTNFIQNINQVRALEGELARTIGSLGPIKAARVHLVLPQRELFSRENRPASASVFIQLNQGARLEREQIMSIQSLVASAVPNMKADSVSVIDSQGNLLARGGEQDTSLMAMKAEEMRRAYETRLTQSVEDIIGRTVGYGRVRATVTAELNFDRVTTSEEVFDPESQVARSVQTVEELNSEKESAPQDVSVQNNLPGISGDLLGEPGSSAEGSRVEETTNFEISKTVRNRVSEVGEVKRLSVAVLVDGTYATDAEGNKTYQPRSEQELEQIRQLVRSAIGYDEKRGDTVEIVNMQFADMDLGIEDTSNLLFGFERSDILRAAEIITVAIMVILVVLLVLQPMVGRLLATEGLNADEDEGDQQTLLSARAPTPALTGPGGEQFSPPETEEEDSLIDMKQVEGKVKASSVRKVEDIVSTYPAETVSVIRSWMSQES